MFQSMLKSTYFPHIHLRTLKKSWNKRNKRLFLILVLRAQEHHQKSSLENKRVSESRYWTNEERQRFKKALKTFGTDFSAIAKFVGTRSSTQVRTHAQKYYAKLIRDYKRSGKTQAAGKGREEKEVSNKRLVSL
ncbi:hypothetical protein O6H91_06G035100 [Diphasiastrum complanatum]|uniref:Uncharacterized protein n=1 Tax=Diphasiastrum complanatum TaxID=34168 RepID=A0ACC2DCQ4_DIPCM|nr:hypothetical protein O6H91_Y083300 [Diphasiastrum complanatum]KAJ7551934.1 hypothetical protein O6H91_06G035100 [Diphasiastrum complanatum]